jgi:hypothetical protein
MTQTVAITLSLMLEFGRGLTTSLCKKMDVEKRFEIPRRGMKKRR